MADFDAVTEKQSLLQLVSFNLGREEFGLDILRVQEIIKWTVITKLPNAPDFIEGIINLRGKVIPIVDLRVRMGMHKSENTGSTRIIIVDLASKNVGFIVDSVNEVLRIPEGITEPPPSVFNGNKSDFITGVGKLEDRLLLLFDIDKILTSDEEDELGVEREN